LGPALARLAGQDLLSLTGELAAAAEPTQAPHIRYGSSFSDLGAPPSWVRSSLNNGHVATAPPCRFRANIGSRCLIRSLVGARGHFTFAPYWRCRGSARLACFSLNAATTENCAMKTAVVGISTPAHLTSQRTTRSVERNYCPNSARAASTRASIGDCPNCKNIRFASVRC
jgi:hypothetical protein